MNSKRDVVYLFKVYHNGGWALVKGEDIVEAGYFHGELVRNSSNENIGYKTILIVDDNCKVFRSLKDFEENFFVGVL